MYWKPVWAILEDDFELLLVNAGTSRTSPAARPTSRMPQWLCQLLEAGLLRASFVPPSRSGRLRQLTRYRKTQIQERQREANRLPKALEDTGIKLDCVATDILGKSGRAMLDALVTAPPIPSCSPTWPGKLRTKIPALKEALEGRFDALHALLSDRSSRTWTSWTSRSSGSQTRSRSPSRPFEARLNCCADPWVQAAHRGIIIAEIGIDMSVSPRQAPGLLGRQCPGNDQSAGKRRSGRTRKGSSGSTARSRTPPWPRTAPTTATSSPIPAPTPRLGHGRALGAVKHSILFAGWHMLQHRRALQRPRWRLLPRRDPERTTKRLVAQLEALGHTVTLQEAVAA